ARLAWRHNAAQGLREGIPKAGKKRTRPVTRLLRPSQNQIGANPRGDMNSNLAFRRALAAASRLLGDIAFAPKDEGARSCRRPIDFDGKDIAVRRPQRRCTSGTAPTALLEWKRLPLGPTAGPLPPITELTPDPGPDTTVHSVTGTVWQLEIFPCASAVHCVSWTVRQLSLEVGEVTPTASASAAPLNETTSAKAPRQKSVRRLDIFYPRCWRPALAGLHLMGGN